MSPLHDLHGRTMLVAQCVVLGKSDELGYWYFDDDLECFYL
jgi:hypothetical protein